jgi:hypothetical protein
MLRCVALVRSDVSEERITSFIRVTTVGVLRLLVNDNIPSSTTVFTLMMEAINFSETSALKRVTLRNVPEYGILDGHCGENFISY